MEFPPGAPGIKWETCKMALRELERAIVAYETVMLEQVGPLGVWTAARAKAANQPGIVRTKIYSSKEAIRSSIAHMKAFLEQSYEHAKIFEKTMQYIARLEAKLNEGEEEKK